MKQKTHSIPALTDLSFPHSRRRIVYSDLSNIAPEHYTKGITARLTDIKAVSSPGDRGVFIQVLESVYRFSLGAFAGGKFLLVFKWNFYGTKFIC